MNTILPFSYQIMNLHKIAVDCIFFAIVVPNVITTPYYWR